MLSLSIQVVILIASIIGILAAVMLGIQTATEGKEVGYGFVVVFGAIIAAVLVGLWYDPSSISLSIYLVIIAAWLFMTRRKSPRVLAGMILIIPVAVLIYVRKAQYGFDTAVVAAIISYIIALISLIIATVKYNQRNKVRRTESNYRPETGDYYNYGRNSSQTR